MARARAADGVSGQAERPAPSGCEAALVFDHGNGFLAGVATSVALFPGGGAGGNVLNTVEFVYWDADHALAAVFVFGAQERSGLVGDDVWMVVLALVVTLPAHWEQVYCPRPPSSCRFRAHRHRARLTYRSGGAL